MSLSLHTHAKVTGVDGVRLLKVLTAEQAETAPFDHSDVILWDAVDDSFAGAMVTGATAGIGVVDPRDAAVIQPGDVIRVRPDSSMVSVLFRRASRTNSLFATERCNSRCLMCSQPPRDEDDGWRVGELLKLVELIDKDIPQLGITGGEPTLLGSSLARVIDAVSEHLPDTHLHILTNGRTFSDPGLAMLLAERRKGSTVWAVPLYADHADLHDEVVDASAAFEETLQGLFHLGRLGARIEIRVVLHKMTVDRLAELASFIYRRLPFVEHVALMGLEPMGYAKGNREHLWIDPVDYIEPLRSATYHLANRGISTSIYNLPLCVLPTDLWSFARQSISEWKNTLAPECVGCELSDQCSGFFASAGPTWRSRAVRPLKREESAYELA